MPETQHLDENAILRQAIHDLEPQVPIRSWQRDDDVLTLYLADGRTIRYDWRSRRSADLQIPDDLDDLLKAELQEIAKTHNIDGYSTMLKAELLQALEELRDE